MKMKKVILLFAVFVGLFLGQAVLASEKINSFDVSIKINPDSSIDVEEKIDYDFGFEQRHGIFREIPIKYKARGGNYNLRISGIEVFDEENNPYNFEVSYPGRYAKIKIGDADKFVSGEKTYVIRYKIKRAINYFDSYDELYWNATGDEWKVPIENSRVSISLPQKKINKGDLQKACFAGYSGSNEECDLCEYDCYGEYCLASAAMFEQYFLNSGEGLTVVVGFPKELVVQPSSFQLFLETLKDNLILFLPLIIFGVCFYLWKAHGRDPKGRETIVTQFEAPDNLTPAEVGTIIDEKAHKKDISAEIINLAIKGYIKIIYKKREGIFKPKDYILERLKGGEGLENEFEKKLMKGFFGKSLSKKSVKLSSLKNKFYKTLEKVKKEIYKSTVEKKYFPRNPNKIRGTYLGIGILTLFLSFFGAFFFGFLGFVSFILSGITIIAFGLFMPAKTKKGVLAKEHILGLKRYLSVAEKERIKFHNAPEKKPERFEKLLPYAMVLGVEKEWAKQFEGIYNQEPEWYSGPAGRGFSSYALVSGLGGFSANANASLASRPSSASGGGSGFSGGGSGGGFGGGGGGSW